MTASGKHYPCVRRLWFDQISVNYLGVVDHVGCEDNAQLILALSRLGTIGTQ